MMEPKRQTECYAVKLSSILGHDFIPNLVLLDSVGKDSLLENVTYI